MKFTEKEHQLGFIEAYPKPSIEELTRHYQEKYFQDPKGAYQEDYLPEELAHMLNLAAVADKTTQKLSCEKTLFDVGCGEGFFTKNLLSLGWNVKCCDFSSFALKKFHPELLQFFDEGDALQLISKSVEAGEKFGLVNLQNVLEHVLEPIDLLLSLKGLLGSSSALRIKVPNDYSDFQKRLVDENMTTNTWFAPPEHLSFFNAVTLANTLDECGYEVLSSQVNFPIEVFLTNPNSNYWKDRSLGKAAHNSRILIENFLISQSLDDYISFSEASAKLGFGRELIVYARPKNSI
ncbi:class I SAM-dependent methyltransferase [Agarivorans litoreus]|uniref:class I SAM-dependent methyltransferase n=1 Tax=Agarivorans litoreus TaxID=1510455 RepID=UPI001C7DA401|nr:methyltransferase domain-containing protein [Agarivorans litoreus]